MQFWDKKVFQVCSCALVQCPVHPRLARGRFEAARINRPQQNYGVFRLELILILRITEMTRHKMPVNELPGHTERVNGSCYRRL
jgi:hypothetical protein